MARKLPAVQLDSTPIPMGQNESQLIYDWDLRALVVSFGHKRRKGVWTSGGPFMAVRETLKHEGGRRFDLRFNGVPWQGRSIGVVQGVKPPPKVSAGKAGWGGGSNGELRNNAWVEGFPSFNDQVRANQGRFATGWARTRPGNPEADVFVTLAELRNDGLPSMVGGSFIRITPFNQLGKVAGVRARWYSDLYSRIGSEYLNVEFGWKPFIRDLRNIYHVMKTLDKQLAQLKRDNNRSIRRRGVVEDSTETFSNSTVTTAPNTNVAGAPPNWFRQPARTTTTITTTTTLKSWFAAAYLYHIADTQSWAWDKRAKAVLFGALPTPGAVWNALPWSWMHDWFFNVGDIMSNMSTNAVDNLVARYAFVMTHHKVTTVHHCESSFAGRTPTWNTNVPGGSTSTSTTNMREVKFRCSGSPYGLGVQYGSLSNYQKGVIAALGVSRSRFD